MDNDSALVTLAGQARDYLRQSKAPNTRRAYRADWAHFESWCSAAGRTSLPAAEDTLVLYFSALAAVSKVSTIERRLAALSQAHQAFGYLEPIRGATLRALLAGIRRAKGIAPETKAPLLADELRTVLGHISEDPRGLRDRALLLLGFAGGFRRSELVAVDIADVVFSSEGVAVTLRRSKTDPEGQGRKIGIPRGARPETCPVRALAAWLWSAVPARWPPRAAGRKAAIGPVGCFDCETTRARGGPRSDSLFGSQLARRPRHQRRPERCERALHYEPDRPSEFRHGTALHTRSRSVP